MKALVIPAYQPSEALLQLLQDLPADAFAAIVVVDDGSGPEYAEIFARAAALPKVQVARHAMRIGRGAAVRTGIHAALVAAPDLTHIVTAGSSDSAAAILQISSGGRDHATALILGTRQRRRSILTAAATRGLVGQALSEPDTTLRSLPVALLPHLLRMESNGPEFDIEMLLVAGEHSTPVLEEAVEEPLDEPVQAHSPSWRAPLAMLKFALESRPYRAVGFAFALLTSAILIAVTIAEIHGFATGHLFSQMIWFPWGERRLGHFTALFAAWSLPVLIMVPWSYASLLAALIALATLLATGPLAVAAIVFFLVSAGALGSKLLSLDRKGEAEPHSPEAHICATLVGIALYAFAMTLTARIPMNYAAVWAAVLAIPILLDARGAVRRFRELYTIGGVSFGLPSQSRRGAAREELRSTGGQAKAYPTSGEALSHQFSPSCLTTLVRSVSLPNWPERGAFALLAFVLSIHWFAALEPETSSDGLAMHLAVPANIAAHHAMTFRPDLFLWSVMPMGADFTYALVYLLGGEPAISLFNFTLLLAIAALIYSTSRRWLPRAPALVVTALFASTPLVNLVTGSLFIENFVTAMILGMLVTLWRFRETGQRSLLFAVATLGGAAAAAKLGACVFVVMAIPFAIVEARRQWNRLGARPAVTGALAVALLLTIAAPTYLIAYAQTGNPVFPFLNTKIHSPLLDPKFNFTDNRYNQPLGWSTPFNLTFHTNNYFEAQNGAFGFQYLLLIPLALIALLAVRRYAAGTAAVVALAAGVTIMATQPNARYVYATLPLLAIPFGALLARFAVQQRWLTRALLAAALVFIGFNIYFEAASGWYHKHFDSLSLFHPGGRAQYLRETAPIRDVTQRFRRAQPQAPVLLVTENDLTDAGDHVYEYEWHQYAVWKQIYWVQSVTELRQIFNSLGIRYFIAHRPGPDDAAIFPLSLGEFLANCTAPEVENGRFYVARVIKECESFSDADLEAWLENLPPALVRPGVYDDFDLALRFRGHWTRSRDFAGPYRHSISYTNVPDAQVTFAFEGTSLTYVYSKAINRGIAQISIDGESHTIDLYSPTVQWQASSTFCCLAPGRHLVELRNTGQNRAESKDVYIDLDGFIAK